MYLLALWAEQYRNACGNGQGSLSLWSGSLCEKLCHKQESLKVQMYSKNIMLKTIILSKIWCFHNSDYKDNPTLGCDTVMSSRYVLTFQKNLSHMQLVHLLWQCRNQVPLKHSYTFMRLYGITFQNTVISITIIFTANWIALQEIPVKWHHKKKIK